MHPEYRQHTEDRKGQDALRFRVSKEERAALEMIARVEGGTITDLLVEGVWRVIEDRRQDPQFQANSERAIQLQDELETVRSELHQKS